MPAGDQDYNLGGFYYNLKVAVSPLPQRNATAAVRALLDAGWTAEEAYRVVRVFDTLPNVASDWPDGTVLCTTASNS